MLDCQGKGGLGEGRTERYVCKGRWFGSRVACQSNHFESTRKAKPGSARGDLDPCLRLDGLAGEVRVCFFVDFS